MLFNDLENPFGAAVFATPASVPTRTTYYKSIRLERKPSVRMPSAPKPISTIIKNFILS